MKDILKKMKFKMNIQIAIAVTISIFIAYSLNLKYYASAGIITLLTVQNTKRDTLKFAIRRMFTYIITLLLCVFLYNTLGYSFYTLGIFVLIIGLISSFYGMGYVLSVNVVFATHFLDSRSMGFDLLMNETYLFLIGVLMGLIINLVTPMLFFDFRNEIRGVDDVVKNLLREVSGRLRGIYYIEDVQTTKEMSDIYISNQFKEIKKYIWDTESKLLENANNMIFKEEKYYLDYFIMRTAQINIIEDIFESSKKLYKTMKQAQLIADFMDNIILQYHETNTVEYLSLKAEEILEIYRKQPLPVTREEFEHRAMLYSIMHDLILLIKEKRNFVMELTEETRNKYWSKE
ncbi:MAG: aromatic acid exporter family protein [Tissierellia bacterium]|nr:aromatic acid exporter family protein [Tissierellia bacterium]